MSMNAELGNVSFEFFPQMLRSGCELLVEYRELYWFRSLPPWSLGSIRTHLSPPLHVKAARNDVPVGESCPADEKDAQQDSSGGNAHIVLLEAGVQRLLSDADRLLAGKDLNVSMKLGEFSVELREDRAAKQPFLSFTTPSANVSINRKGEHVKTSAFGFTLTSNKGSAFISSFATV